MKGERQYVKHILGTVTRPFGFEQVYAEIKQVFVIGGVVCQNKKFELTVQPLKVLEDIKTTKVVFKFQFEYGTQNRKNGKT